MPVFSCDYCNTKPFASQHRLSQHRASVPDCKRQYEEYILNYPSTILSFHDDSIEMPRLYVAENDDKEEEDEDDDIGDILGTVYRTSSNGSLDDQAEVESLVHFSEEEEDELAGMIKELNLAEHMDIVDDDLQGHMDEDPRFPPEGVAINHQLQQSDPVPSRESIQQSPGHLDPPATSTLAPPPTQKQQPNHREPMEDVDTDVIDYYPEAGRIWKKVATPFAQQWYQRLSSEDAPGNDFTPFASRSDLELGLWLSESGLPMVKIDEFLKLDYVKQRKPSFQSASSLREKVQSLPEAGPRWKVRTVVPDSGDAVQTVEFCYRDPIEAIEYLLSRPSLGPFTFGPRQVWADQTRQSQKYSDISTGAWWWDVQDTLSAGRTVLPILLASDETRLTNFSGDKVAWPIYLTLGNIDMKTRRTISSRAWVLIAYVPVVNWDAPKEHQNPLSMRLFHQCVKSLLQPLIKPGRDGMNMLDYEGYLRICHPRLAAWLGDHPEKLMINCVLSKSCPTSLATSKDLDNPQTMPSRTTAWILRQRNLAVGKTDPSNLQAYMDTAATYGLNAVHAPFWEDLPGYEAHLCMAPDLFHGILKFWRDHMLKWIRRLVGDAEIDRRLLALQPIVGARQFKRGISHITQWTGREDRDLQKIMLAVVAGAPRVSPKVLKNQRAFNAFAYFAQYRIHSTETLTYMKDALQTWFQTLNVYIETKVRYGKKKSKPMHHFKIPKISTFHSYEESIRQLGSSTQFSTEITETYHKPWAKMPYKATNHRNYLVQMCRYIDRKERIAHFYEMLLWAQRSEEEERLNDALSGTSPLFRTLAIKRFHLHQQPRLTQHQRQKASSEKWFNAKPAASDVSIDAIATIYHIPSFAKDLENFMQFPPEPYPQLRGKKVSDILRIDLFKTLRVRNPDPQGDEDYTYVDTLQALPPSKNGSYPYGHGHCVLIPRTHEALDVGIRGHYVGQARVFFRIHLLLDPNQQLDQNPEIRPHERKPQGYKRPKTQAFDLVYVHHFTIPRDQPEADIKMYKFYRSFASSGARAGSIESIGAISRFVQLVPNFGAMASEKLTAGTSTEISKSFHLNSFWTQQIFQSVT